MRISKPTLTHTSLNKLVFVINFFTLLRAAWLLHPSQSTKTSCDITDFSSTPIFPTIFLTMAPAHSKDTNSAIRPCSDSRHSKNHILAKPKPKPKGSSIGLLSNLSMEQIVSVVTPTKDDGTFFNCTKEGLEDVDLGKAVRSDVAVDFTVDVDFTDDSN